MPMELVALDHSDLEEYPTLWFLFNKIPYFRGPPFLYVHGGWNPFLITHSAFAVVSDSVPSVSDSVLIDRSAT